MIRDTLLSQYASTHQNWNSYLKEYRRYAQDRKRDGRTDGRRNEQSNYYIPPTVPLGAENSFVRKAELMIAANQVCIYKTSLYEA